ncbi:MAG TPA: hypothetical protein VJ438_05320 [Candidatus Nanoarchaeia archaeon]|nr:hypothetical protein [Candidatus Nanoarchaeia archaeon]
MVSKKLFLFLGLILILGMVSALPSSVNITYPENTNYNDTIAIINWSFGGTLNSTTDFCWYKLNLDDWENFNCSNNPLTGITSLEGDNNWKIKVNDSIGTTDVGEIDFWVDSIAPKIIIISPVLNPIFLQQDYFNVNTSVTETNPNTIMFTVTSVSSITETRPYSDGITEIFRYPSAGSVGDGNYTYTIRANDTLGHLSVMSGIVILDHTPAYFSNINTSDNVYGEGKDYTFSIQWDDSLSGVDSGSVVFEFEGTGYGVVNVGNMYYANVSDLAAGDYDYSWSANDNAGNSNSTGTLSYTVDKAYPILSLDALPTWNEDYLIETEIVVSCPTQLTCKLYRNDESVTAPDTQTLGVGSYVYVYNTSGNQNYTEASINGTLIINKISPKDGMSVTGTSPIVYGTASDFQGTETNTGDDDCVYELYANNTLIPGNVDNTVYGYGIVSYLYNTSGCSNYTDGSVSGWLQINKASQNIELTINDTEVDYTESFTVTCNGNLTRNGDSVGFNETITETLGAGTYEYNCSLEESANYQYNESISSATVNKIPSSVQLYLNGVADNLTVEYMEFFLIEGNVSDVLNTEDGQAKLWVDGFLITPVNESKPNVSTYTFMLQGTYEIKVNYSSQNYSSSSDTLFVTVNPRVITSSGGGSCNTAYNCTLWTEWSVCDNWEQNRSCLEWEEVRCSQGVSFDELKEGQTQSCMVYSTLESSTPRSIQEGEPVVVPEPAPGFFSRVTGGAIGLATSGTGIVIIVTILVLSSALGIIHYSRRKLQA